MFAKRVVIVLAIFIANIAPLSNTYKSFSKSHKMGDSCASKKSSGCQQTVIKSSTFWLIVTVLLSSAIATIVYAAYESRKKPSAAFIETQNQLSSKKLLVAVSGGIIILGLVFGVMYLTTPHLYTNIDVLRKVYGHNKAWVSGKSSQKTRELYHFLISDINGIKEGARVYINNILTRLNDTCQAAKAASDARRAARIYTREQGNIWVSLFSKSFSFLRYGSVNGLEESTLWNNKAEKIEESCVNKFWDEKDCKEVCEAILKSASKTNKWVDKINAI